MQGEKHFPSRNGIRDANTAPRPEGGPESAIAKSAFLLLLEICYLLWIYQFD